LAGDRDDRVITVNRRARHEYDIEETYDAGLVLTGTEIKSVRAGQAHLREAYARLEGGEIWLHGMRVAHYQQGGRENVDPGRPRKLLLHRREINRLMGKVQEQGLTLIPLRLYLRRGLAKLELGLARGRKMHDKRRAIAEREIAREREGTLKQLERERQTRED
jgi:SsrA-binding protein